MNPSNVVAPVVPPRASSPEQALLHVRALPALLSILTLALGLIYLAVIPPWGGPDEPRHYEYVRLLYEKGRLVSWSDADKKIMIEIIRSMDAVNYWKWGVSEWKPNGSAPLPNDFLAIYPQNAHELHQPPLAYLLYLVPLELTRGSGILAQLYAMRLLSILLNVVVVLAAYYAGRELFPQDPTLALALPIFIMLLPQHLFLHSTVSNDHLTEAALAWLFVILLRVFRLGLSLPRVLGLVACTAIALAAKRTGLYALPILGIAFFAYAFAHWGGGRMTTTQKSIRLAITVIVLALGAVGVVYAWRWLGAHQPQLQDYIVRLFLFLPTQQFPFQLDARVIAPSAFRLYAAYLKNVFISIWGHFGWMNITLGVQIYWGFAALSALAFGGLVWFAVRDLPKWESWRRAVLFVFAASVLVALAATIGLQVRFWDLGWGGAPQGRYLFPVLIPLATLFLLGLRAFFPRARYLLWFALLTGAMALYNFVALAFFIIPFYRA
jgi:hypothetical protein